MAYYRVRELADLIDSGLKDGFEYVEINISEPDDEFPESINFSFIDADHTEEDAVDSVELPDEF